MSRAARTRAQEILDALAFADRARDRVENLSLGNQQRVQLAAALVHRPDVLVLDEPFSGLDPVGTDVLVEMLDRERRERGVPMCSRATSSSSWSGSAIAAMILDGRIVADGTIEELRASRERRLLRVEVSGDEDGWFESIPGVRLAERLAGGVVLELEDGTDHQRVLDLARSVGEVRHSAWSGRRCRSSSARWCRRERRAGRHRPRDVAGGRLSRLLGPVARQGVRDLHVDHARRPHDLHPDPRLRRGPDAFTLGVVGNDDLGRRVSALGERSGLDVTVVRLDDAPAADASLRDGDVDAVVLGDVDEGTATSASSATRRTSWTNSSRAPPSGSVSIPRSTRPTSSRRRSTS